MIELKNLIKRFGDFTAMDHLRLRIETGKFFGLLGPNGSGKTSHRGIVKISSSIMMINQSVYAQIFHNHYCSDTKELAGSISLPGQFFL